MTEAQYDKAMGELEEELEAGLLSPTQFDYEVQYLNEVWEEENAGGL